eukprot:TRINITY_DN4597_c0_g1_i4.p2 TRINITY_DN4597_c0_g1~~TRINITY_DN4597_c0_g1_i4.p2  ORF type:complete len:165 (-),score=19.95 TRINITY_DN4597_c0_g1_i4:778-1272(-)
MKQMHQMMQEKSEISSSLAKLEREHHNTLEQLYYLENMQSLIDEQNYEREQLMQEMFQLQRHFDQLLLNQHNIKPQSMQVILPDVSPEAANLNQTSSSMASYEYDDGEEHDDDDDGDVAYLEQPKSMDPTKEIEPQSFSDCEGDQIQQGVGDIIEEGMYEGLED